MKLWIYKLIFPHLNWKNQYNKLKELKRKKFSKNVNK
jgi:hypothetical protein